MAEQAKTCPFLADFYEYEGILYTEKTILNALSRAEELSLSEADQIVIRAALKEPKLRCQRRRASAGLCKNYDCPVKWKPAAPSILRLLNL